LKEDMKLETLYTANDNAITITSYTLDRRRGFERISEAQWAKDSIPDVHGKIEDVILPIRKTFKSAGYDLHSTLDFTLAPNEEILIPLGFKVYMMEDECFMIYSRSGLGFKYYARLSNGTGVIDSDFYQNQDNEGHCWAKIRVEGNKTMSIKKGDAIAQGIFQKFLLIDGDSFATGKKRIGGIGSTG
jgi:dUTP diphosphatase